MGVFSVFRNKMPEVTSVFVALVVVVVSVVVIAFAAIDV